MGHRLAWLYIYDEDHMVDHIDGNRSNNRIANLRKCNNKQNAANMTVSGNKGVYFRNGKYEVGIKVNQKRIYLGLFKTLEEAKEAYKQAAIKYFGEFARW